MDCAESGFTVPSRISTKRELDNRCRPECEDFSEDNLTLFIGPGGEVDDRGEHGLFVKSKLGGFECVVYGPYYKYAAGEYEVKFEFATDETFVNDGRDVCAIDVTSDFGQQFIRALVLNSSALVAGGTKSITLVFTIDRPAMLEFGVMTKGLHRFSVKHERNAERIGVAALGDLANKFYQENIRTFQDYEFAGATVVPCKDGVVVNLMGLAILTQVKTDFVLIREILRNNNYQFRANGKFCVIDVGMNIRVASLFFAKMPQVQTVYSFEPLKAPFGRAQENFALNPSLSEKIRAQQIALAGKVKLPRLKYLRQKRLGLRHADSAMVT